MSNKIKKVKRTLFGKIVCAECVDYYERQMAYVAGQRIYVWQCRGRVHHNGCTNHRIREEKVLKAVEATPIYEKAIVNKDGTIRFIGATFPIKTIESEPITNRTTNN